MKSITVKKFDDYRKLLLAFYEYEYEASNNTLSRKAFAAKLGLSDSNFRMICSRKRSLSLENSLTISKRIKLSPQDAEHFINLVYKDSLKTVEAKKAFESHLTQVRSERHMISVKAINEDALLDSKLQAILVYIKDRKIDLKKDDLNLINEVAKKVNLAAKDVRKIFEKILSLDIKIDDPDGIHVVFSKLSNNYRRDDYFRTEFQAASLNVKNIRDPNFFYSVKVFSIPRDQLNKFGEDYKLLCEKHIALAETIELKDALTVVKVLFHMAPIIG